MLDPLRAIVLELHRRFGRDGALSIGGGLGLYLKQAHLEQERIRTLYPIDTLPTARTTADVDVFLRAEVVADSDAMERLRSILDELGFAPVPGAEFMQFTRPLGSGAGTAKIDLLVGPLAGFADRVRIEARRVKPAKKGVGLHAHRVDEALGIETEAVGVPLEGTLLSGRAHRMTVMIPSTFPYLLMKLMAFKDRLADEEKDLGRYHAVDAYRTVGLATEREIATARKLASEYADHPVLKKAVAIVESDFGDVESIGCLRIREWIRAHTFGATEPDLTRLASDMIHILRG